MTKKRPTQSLTHACSHIHNHNQLHTHPCPKTLTMLNAHAPKWVRNLLVFSLVAKELRPLERKLTAVCAMYVCVYVCVCV